MTRDELKTIKDLVMDMSKDIQGQRHYQHWEAYDKDDADSVMDAMEKDNAALRHNLEDWKAENEALKERIKELEASKPKWISVDDAMPKGDALLLHENGLINVGGYIEEDKIWIGFGHVQLYEVHHWMPLPQPIKENLITESPKSED